jgi:hypothetical protein
MTDKPPNIRGKPQPPTDGKQPAITSFFSKTSRTATEPAALTGDKADTIPDTPADNSDDDVRFAPPLPVLLGLAITTKSSSPTC